MGEEPRPILNLRLMTQEEAIDELNRREIEIARLKESNTEILQQNNMLVAENRDLRKETESLKDKRRELIKIIDEVTTKEFEFKVKAAERKREVLGLQKLITKMATEGID